jgi:hypothetical protein
MELHQQIEHLSSKHEVNEVVRFIDHRPEAFATVMELFFSSRSRVAQRAAWVAGHCAERQPELILPYLEPMVNLINKPVNDGVKRNTLRMLQHVSLPESLQGVAADSCFEIIRSAKEATAVKVFALTVLYNVVKVYPELANELKLCITEQLPYASAGFQSRGKKILAKLEKLGTFES